MLSASEATDLGVVHAAVPRAELMAAALLPPVSAQRSPWTVGMLKRAVYGGFGRPLATGLLLEQIGLLVTSTSEQGRRGMRALLTRFPSREPVPARVLLDALAGSAALDLGGDSNERSTDAGQQNKPPTAQG